MIEKWLYDGLKPGDMCTNVGAMCGEDVSWIAAGNTMLFLSYCDLNISSDWMEVTNNQEPGSPVKAANVLYCDKLVVVYPSSRLKLYKEKEDNA